jgi:opacity protein-like surface antigen
MMRKLALLVGILLCVPLAARAQTNNNEVFAGYSFMPMDAFPPRSGPVISGWEGSYTFKLSDYFGLTGDTSGHYGSINNARLNFHSYYGGAQVSLPLRFSPFVHVMLGDTRLSFQSIVTNKFSVAMGGGVDYRASPSVSFRLVQVDYLSGLHTQATPDSRISMGIVFRF